MIHVVAAAGSWRLGVWSGSLDKCLPLCWWGWLRNELQSRPGFAAVWLERGASTASTGIRSAHRGSHSEIHGGIEVKVMIGVDPHKRSHTAVAVDEHESEIGRVEERSADSKR